MDSVVEVILNLLSLALELHCFCWHSCPLWGEGVFRLAQPRYALSFPDSVSSGKDSGKLPRKSIQRYFAMYPRINRQVSLLRFSPDFIGHVFSPCTEPVVNIAKAIRILLSLPTLRKHFGQILRLETMQENHYPGKILWLRKHFAFPALSFN